MNAHTKMSPDLSRRALLAGVGTLTVAFSLRGAPADAAQDLATQPGKTVAATDVDAYLAIDAKGEVTLFSGKVDIGTGLETALTQMVAEELDVPMSRVKVIQGDTALTPDQGTSSGSNSIQKGGLQIRQAAATARHALLAEAAKRLNVPADSLSVTDGTIHAKAAGGSVSYAELIGGKHFDVKLDPKALSKNPNDFTIVGKPVARLDIPAKCTGSFTYMQDYRVPGMLHGRVVRPPAIGATLQSVDEGSVKGHPGPHQDRAGRHVPRGRRQDRMGCDQGGDAAQGTMVVVGGSTRPVQAVGPRPRDQGGQGGRDQQHRQVRDGIGRRGADGWRQAVQGDLRLHDPHARLDRAVLRHR